MLATAGRQPTTAHFLSHIGPISRSPWQLFCLQHPLRGLNACDRGSPTLPPECKGPKNLRSPHGTLSRQLLKCGVKHRDVYDAQSQFLKTCAIAASVASQRFRAVSPRKGAANEQQDISAAADDMRSRATLATRPRRLVAAAAGCFGRIQALVLAEYEFSNLLAFTDFQIGPT
jgi:hypothetical protein